MESRQAHRFPLWIWLLVPVLIALIGVPFLAMGMAIQRSGWISGGNTLHPAPTLGPTVHDQADHLAGLRSTLEKTDEGAFREPDLGTAPDEIRIKFAEREMDGALSMIHSQLESSRIQFLDTRSQGVTRILVMLTRGEWSSLTARLEGLMEKYSGTVEQHHDAGDESTGRNRESMLGVLVISQKETTR
jgi:hypothetical protein